MGRIVVSENVSIDGVMQDPTGEEGFSRGGWFGQIGDADRRAWGEMEAEEARAAGALLLGRAGYTWFAARWPSRTGEWADRLNSLPKYVVSATLHDPVWNNTTVLTGEVADEVSRIESAVAGDVVVYASHRLVHALLRQGLVDELRLTVFPVVLGSGQRLFEEAADRRPMRLLGVRTVGSCLARLTYRPVRTVESPAGGA